MRANYLFTRYCFEAASHKQYHTAKIIDGRLEELYSNEFNVHEKSVRKFVAKLRKELVMVTDGSLQLEYPPGEAQVDFREARII
ncbi:hypothetical protein E4V42_21965 [Clostridium estertheticum]|uniref:Uncharacterized protein n=1 Tax=Clostridium estertheticum TaxID=238834 RepID=A0A5N7IUU7_9CLOT|nr:hypothetical protein [Clostridium estertheticum]MPQ34061.1 hypothetical protein [Clostridium estertheticum]MPQ64862.1 hypothetical protein [Clostridium estertheticum]